MKEYEVLVEEITPCGGEQHARKSILEIEAESPEAYVEENRRYPVLEQLQNQNGDTVVITGDSHGYIVRYTFTE
ncbi:MAG: hypothetical protein E7454_04225 [Ruminococcaceae bacterium]|nr:hypothetical protein [Oscillospiraceae bacterium]